MGLELTLRRRARDWWDRRPLEPVHSAGDGMVQAAMLGTHGTANQRWIAAALAYAEGLSGSAQRLLAYLEHQVRVGHCSLPVPAGHPQTTEGPLGPSHSAEWNDGGGIALAAAVRRDDTTLLDPVLGWWRQRVALIDATWHGGAKGHSFGVGPRAWGPEKRSGWSSSNDRIGRIILFGAEPRPADYPGADEVGLYLLSSLLGGKSDRDQLEPADDELERVRLVEPFAVATSPTGECFAWSERIADTWPPGPQYGACSIGPVFYVEASNADRARGFPPREEMPRPDPGWTVLRIGGPAVEDLDDTHTLPAPAPEPTPPAVGNPERRSFHAVAADLRALAADLAAAGQPNKARRLLALADEVDRWRP